MAHFPTARGPGAALSRQFTALAVPPGRQFSHSIVAFSAGRIPRLRVLEFAASRVDRKDMVAGRQRRVTVREAVEASSARVKSGPAVTGFPANAAVHGRGPTEPSGRVGGSCNGSVGPCWPGRSEVMNGRNARSSVILAYRAKQRAGRFHGPTEPLRGRYRAPPTRPGSLARTRPEVPREGK